MGAFDRPSVAPAKTPGIYDRIRPSSVQGRIYSVSGVERPHQQFQGSVDNSDRQYAFGRCYFVDACLVDFAVNVYQGIGQISA
jgi:hypothetical protein